MLKMIHVLSILKKHSPPENIAKIDNLINDGPHITIPAIKESMGISRGSIQNILHGDKTCKKMGTACFNR